MIRSGDMKLTGYSERGLVNSLLYEIYYHDRNLELLGELLAQVSFPARLRDQPSFKAVKSAEILVEQSLSDFGDSDCILLLENGDKKQTVFIEAKVSTCQPPTNYLEREFGFLKKDLDAEKLGTSGLFSQLYLKSLLAAELHEPGGSDSIVDHGIKVDECLKCRGGTVRKIGGNKVVLRATKRIAEYLGEAFYIAVIPWGWKDDGSIISAMAAEVVDWQGCHLRAWSEMTHNLGFVTWPEVAKFCKTHSLSNTLAVFSFNDGQITEGYLG